MYFFEYSSVNVFVCKLLLKTTCKESIKMDRSEFMHHWGYFCSLAERLDNTKHYIDHGLQQNEEGNMELAHGQVYSDHFKQILLLASSEFEVMSKALCLYKGYKKIKNIKDISSIILKEYPRIVEFEVITPLWGNQPLLNWEIQEGEVKGLSWWRSYNMVKHGKAESIKQATLENAIYSLEALYIVDLYLMYELFQNLGNAFAFPTVYFNCKYMPYPTNSGEGRLPDFGNMNPMERIRQEYIDSPFITSLLNKAH